ncbi:archease [Thermosipho atlanticus]|uniref:SHS2 domain-containing protein n=1 Tax=Thermosipho atlanticus DSM 15807 TaxID=1123380 RepID=A0A1M5QUB7_9BACT|nr:archease [Thermosipho atlanticus]SHH17476.1 SHS2 domain-containing protein [Thermosipho atlanticus DSM 15807]
MYKEIDHTADVAYEIKSESFEGILKEILNIIKENYKPKNINCSIKHTQKYKIAENEDGLFDVVNDWIAAIDLGFFPIDIRKHSDVYISEFCSYKGLEGEKFKALTYYNLNIEKTNTYFYTKVVFDV